MTNATTATTKVTKRDKFAMIRAIIDKADVTNKDELLEFIDKEVKQLEKKNSSKKSKTSAENVEIQQNILHTMRSMNRPVRCSELVASLGLSQSKVTSMLTQMKNNGTVIRTEDKKNVFFSVA